MIALEAIRMTLVTIDNDLHSLEICIKEADGMIDINFGFIETPPIFMSISHVERVDVTL